MYSTLLREYFWFVSFFLRDMQLTSSVGIYQSSQTCTWPDCHSPSWTPTLRVHPNFSLVPAMIPLQPFSEGGDLQPQKWGHKWTETPPWQGQKATVSLSWVGNLCQDWLTEAWSFHTVAGGDAGALWGICSCASLSPRLFHSETIPWWEVVSGTEFASKALPCLVSCCACWPDNEEHTMKKTLLFNW